MRSWRAPAVPRLPGHGVPPQLFDTAMGELASTLSGDRATLYVCGITPYDATHIGHAATYVAYDTLVRAWRDAGLAVTYVQNTTDVDDPLIERAARDGVDWRALANSETDLFRSDMEALRVIPPDHYVAVTEQIDEIARAVDALRRIGIAYELEGDWYFDSAAAQVASDWRLGEESHLDRGTMLALSAERGGDPERPGKRDPLDPLLWRGPREGDPSWSTVIGGGRPGWHIECAVIASSLLPLPLTVQGGGRDLVYPHHEYSAGHATALTHEQFAGIYSHAGLVAYHGEKMSKSLGNLVFVSKLTAAGVDPRAIRLAILAHHYREDWEWTDDALITAERRLATWMAWASTASGTGPGPDDIRSSIADDLDTPAALAFVDALVTRGTAPSTELVSAIDALLGIALD